HHGSRLVSRRHARGPPAAHGGGGQLLTRTICTAVSGVRHDDQVRSHRAQGIPERFSAQRKARSLTWPVPVAPQKTSTPVAGSISYSAPEPLDAKSAPSLGRAARLS